MSHAAYRLKTAAENRGGSTARLDILVSGSLASTYTWSLYEVTIDGNWIDDGLGGDIDGLGGDIRRGRLMSFY